MTSRTSCFEPAVFKRDLAKAAPLLGAYFFIALLAAPIHTYNSYVNCLTPDFAPELQHLLYTIGNVAQTVGAFLYGLACACFVFSDLFRARTANFHAALPIRRGSLFLTHYVSGLALSVFPNLIITALTIGATALLGCPQVGTCLECLAANTLSFLFFYSFAALCCQVIGNVVAMPILYGILNFTVPVIGSILVGIFAGFTYGMPEFGFKDLGLDIFSPLLYMLSHNSIEAVSVADVVVGYRYTLWGYLLAIAAIGLVFAVLAFLLYRRREMERSGDVISVRWLRPVFLYGFTLGCSLVIGLIVVMIFGADESFPAVFAALVVGAFIGYFAAQMMLQKTVRVFKKGWLGFGIFCAVILLCLGAMKLDFFGYSRRVPKQAEVASVSLNGYYPYNGGNAELTDPQVIRDTVALHQRFVSERSLVEQEQRHPSGDGWSQDVKIDYRLKNGDTLSRSFPIYISEKNANDPQSLCSQTYALLNSLPVVLAKNTPAWEPAEHTIITCQIVGSHPGAYPDEPWVYDSINLNQKEAFELYQNCILPDLKEGKLGKTQWFFDSTGESLAAEADTMIRSVTISYALKNPQGEYESYSYNLTPEATRTIAAVQPYGFCRLPE